jgi:hypothetical protein
VVLPSRLHSNEHNPLCYLILPTKQEKKVDNKHTCKGTRKSNKSPKMNKMKSIKRKETNLKI